MCIRRLISRRVWQALCDQHARQLAVAQHAAKRPACGLDGRLRARWLVRRLHVELQHLRLQLLAPRTCSGRPLAPTPTPSPPRPAPPRSQNARTLRGVPRPHPSRRPTPSPTVKNRAQTPLRKREPKNLARPNNQAASASALGGAPKNGVNLPPPPPPLPDKEAARSGSADDEAEKEELAISALTAVAQCEHAAAAAAAAASSSSASGACGGSDLKNRVSAVESGGDIGGDGEVAGGASDKRTQPPMNGKPKPETLYPKP
jgi:hypothetical protein